MSEEQPLSQPEPAQSRRSMRAALPFVVTALLSTALAVALTLLLLPAGGVTPQPTALPAPSPSATIRLVLPTEPPPTPTLQPDPEDILTNKVAQLQADNARLRSYLFLLKASGQLQAGRLALRDNQLAAVDRELAAAAVSLELAAGSEPGVKADTINNLRQQVSYLRDDLVARPEELDRRLVELWQSLMALMDNSSEF